jgi:hypothetical protein
MMDGIPQDMTEDDVSVVNDEETGSGVVTHRLLRCNRLTRWYLSQVSAELRDAYHIGGLEDIRVIRDRQTSEWKRIVQSEGSAH